MKLLVQPFSQGQKAKELGLFENANPYKKGTDSFLSWLYGWEMGRSLQIACFDNV